ncbi:MAG: ATP-dependent RecD-like DNA helicase [Chloroflexi bacterium]|nr:ATP-dependent RecD-like DNA helicase [Chloroflexota bacterium]
MLTNSQSAAASERLHGEVERLVYSGDETGYTICRLRAPGHHDLVTVVGNMPGIQPGERLLLEGHWLNHSKYGLQFQVFKYTSLLPATANAIRRYLGSKLIKGIGPIMAARLVDRFGDDTLEIIESSPERLMDVPGIGPKRAQSIRKAWEAQREVREVMLFLQGHGVSSGYAARIYKTYGQDAISIVNENPYRLAQDIRGIGFKTADSIAATLGIDPQSPFRAQAALEHTLREFAQEGHAFYDSEELIAACAEQLAVPEEQLVEGVEALRASGRVVREEEAVYLPELYQTERGSADILKALMAQPLGRRAFDADRAIAWTEGRIGLSLTDTQRQAVRMAVTEKVSVITGGPGTGKTTILKAVLSILEALKLRIVLAAPTGRAAKRLSEATGREARTLHRLLEYRPGQGRFRHDRDNPLEADAVIIDETSMVDIVLMYHLLKAIPRHASLLLVGDVDQLPSVGPGNVLCDILDSGEVPFVRLTDIFRQGERSQIVQQAHRINQGLMPEWTKDLRQPSDFYVIGTDDPDRAAEMIVELCAVRMPRRFGLDPRRDIQVLCPMNRGSVGASALNSLIQERLNPHGEAVSRFGRTFRVGDRVLQTANDYDKGVYNGDLGWITGLDMDGASLTVAYDDGEVSYDFTELDELLPAYAISVHRSQGSEYPAVIIPVMTQHYPMLQRNLLYTAVTRARRLAVLVGNPKAIAIAVKNQKSQDRHSALGDRLHPAAEAEEGLQ